MKAIIVLALFALATNALNLTAYNLGIASEYNLNDTQIDNDVVPCANALNNDIHQIIQLISSEDIGAILEQGVQLYSQLHNDIKVTCLPYALDIATIIQESVDLTEINQVMKSNFGIYFAQVIQEAGMLVNDLLIGNDFQAGQTDAYISEILLGVVQPQTFPVPQVNMSKVTAFNMTNFINEFYPAFFGEMGNNNIINTNSLNACSNQVQNIIVAINTTTTGFSAMAIEDKIKTVKNIVELVVDGIQACEYGIELYTSLVVPVYEAFIQDPVHFVANVLDNYALSMPKYVQMVEQMKVYAIQGQYDLFGETEAQMVMDIYGGLVNFQGGN